MEENKIGIIDVVNFLNELIETDPESLTSLFGKRVECNMRLANHPNVQCVRTKDGFVLVGVIGILNGLFGNINGDGKYIAIQYNSDGLAIGACLVEPEFSNHD